jgi:hypothetical protein
MPPAKSLREQPAVWELKSGKRTGYELRVTSYGLRVTGYELRVAGYGPRVAQAVTRNTR